MTDFKVNDRRLFDKDGNLNEEAGPDSAQEIKAEAGQKPAREPEAAEARGSSAESQSPPLTLGDLPASMTTLIIGLATEAMAQLGEPPDGVPAEAPDLRSAKHTIDLLGILQAKTRGNLDRSEEALLEALLYDLRMKYVAVKKGS
ncbi:MAG: DUF1844 domain-containing protein [Deltaproteobacteria bacterium]|jgi:hypothetical protein|nr:DUF1844 domain-containing protein [Deltaproteobacteria bacterium]